LKILSNFKGGNQWPLGVSRSSIERALKYEEQGVDV
jgi:hypothetical protein